MWVLGIELGCSVGAEGAPVLLAVSRALYFLFIIYLFIYVSLCVRTQCALVDMEVQEPFSRVVPLLLLCGSWD